MIFSVKIPMISNNIIFTGSIDRGSIRHLAQAVDCCVIPSDVETFGLQMVEAISVGTPVISTKCGGPEDVLGDHRLGVLCDKNSVDELSAAMLHVLDNYGAYRAEEIMRIADELLGDDAIKRKWAAVYEGIVPGIGNEP